MKNHYSTFRQVAQTLVLATFFCIAAIGGCAQTAITSFSPAGGPAGTLLTITGTNLSGTTAISINGTSAIVISSTSTSAVGLVMPGTTAGTVSVTASGTATSTTKFTAFAPTAVPAPAPGLQQTKLTYGTGSTGTGVQQGYAVTVSADGNTAVVGGNKDNSSAGGIWVYTRSGTTWTQQGGELIGTGNTGAAGQGWSVAISADGNTIIEGGENDHASKGAAWIFVRSGTTWSQQTILTAGTRENGTGYFGQAVAIAADGNTAVVGGSGDSTNNGAAWVFTRSGTTWSAPAKMVGTGGTGATQRQGYAVAISADGKTALVAGHADNVSVGAVWVFINTAGAWSQQGAKLVGTGGTAAHQGYSVALAADGNTAIVGGYNDASAVGAAWIWTRSNLGVWTQQGSKLVGTGGVTANQGYTVSISADGNTALVGGYKDNSSVGAAWIWTRSGTTWTQQGAKFHGTPYTGTAGSAPQFGNAVALSADGQTAIIGGFQDAVSGVTIPGAAWAFTVQSSSVSIAASQTTICSGASVTFTATPTSGGTTPNYNFLLNGTSVQTGTSATYTSTTLNNNDKVTCIMTSNATDGYSSLSNSITMTVNVLPTAGITGTATGCSSVSLTGTGAGAGSYHWSGGSSVGTAANTFSSSNTYTVTVTDANSCTASASQAVTVYTPPTAGITGTATGCASVSLTATGAGVGGSYLWSGGSSVNTAANTFTSSNTYNVTVTDANTCTTSTSQAVTVNPNPTAGISGTATACGSVSLTATGGGTYSWSGGATPTTDVNTFSSGATYSVTVTLSGCTAVTSQAVTVNPVPAANASNAGPFLPGQTITITSGPSAQTGYAWHGPSGYTASTQNITRTSGTTAMSGTYTVTVTNSSGCSATASTVVAVNGLGDYTWTGATSNVWTVVTNWSPTAPVGGPNGCTENVIIPNTVNDPVISSGISIGNITINDNAQLTLNANLSVCGFLKGGVTTAPLIVGNSHLIMTGTSVQTISGIISANTLEINNTSGGVGNSGNISINKALIMTNGQLGNTGTVTLVSNATGDAYLDNFTSPTAGAFNGNLIVQRYISNSSDGYRDISSPVATSVADLASSFSVFGQNGVDCWYAYNPYPNVQVYNEPFHIATGNFFEHWISYTGTWNYMLPMLGIAARTYNSGPYTITFKGNPYNGAQSTPITHTSTATPASEGWNFIGNPYPSPISWSAVKAMNSAVANGSFYVYHTTAEFAGNWGSHNGVTGVNGATDAIAIGQGFFVNTASSGTFTMNNTVRTTSAGAFYRLGALDNEVRLILSNGANSDEIVTYTDPQATSGYDPDMDAVKMPAGSTVGIAYSLPSHDYAINVMDALTAQTELPLTMYARDSGSYTLAATTLNTPGLTAYLKDAQTNTLTSLTNAISLTLNGGQMYTGRYSVVFKEDITGITNATAASTHIYAVGNRVYVQRPASDPATISVTNLLGQNITDIPSQTEKTDFALPTDQPWYAIVKVTEGQKVTVSKVLLSNK